MSVTHYPKTKKRQPVTGLARFTPVQSIQPEKREISGAHFQKGAMLVSGRIDFATVLRSV